ncbi:uncharacterized protein N7477_007775 [Penicillium maclennaniae]|uniref:uncharacterized protein n=1 Tax=Penicillium maclennaniae TaxID=1343394 RepID=UPI0025409A43|nr:uncharacterized protein N7477_007775 [Penicillium maclennaniae]KAJ5665327.1 hypothetical protein N7477_007775 [Penicillium maclennaniae]
MATPFNPFGAPRGHAQASVTSTSGRGRGSSAARGMTFQPRGSRSRASKWRGAGRGQSMPRGRGGRGAGVAPSGVPHSAASTSQLQSSANNNSPFASISQQTVTGNPFGKQAIQQSQSPFAAIANDTTVRHGQFAPRGGLISKKPPRESQSRSSNSGFMVSVPVEDASSVASYHERYEQLKLDRAKQRQQAIRDGQMADPNQPTSLNQAITPVGTCTSMCPEFERVERIVQKMVDKSEKYLHPSSNALQNMEMKMLKRFRRSAAGYDEQLPSDIRTPKTLLQATNYLIRHVVGGNEPLGFIHKFVWDRTRSIRNDFSVQQVTQEEDVRIAVTCLERIARFHIVSLHLLSSPANEEPFDRHQEREQLNNTMLSLMYYYDDNRGRIAFPNEEEFRAYYVLFSIHDQRPDLEARVQKWPLSLQNSPRVQVALELYAASCNTWDYQGTLDARRPNAIAQGFYTRFFNIINSRSVSYLMACVAEIYFNHVRQTAIRAIWKGYCRQPVSQQSKNDEWTVDELTRVLHFDDDEQTIQFCNDQDLTLDENANGQLYLNWGSRPVDSIAFSPSSEHSFSESYVESKRSGRSLVAVILGMNIREAARMGMVDKSYLDQRTDKSADMTLDDESLFVTDDENETPAPVVEMNSPSLDSEVESNTSNLFQNPVPSSSVNPFANQQPPAQQPLNPPQTSSTANPFASMFSAAPVANNPPASSSPDPNPFSSMFSSGATVKPAPTPSALSTPSPNSFSSILSGGIAASTSSVPATSNAFAAPAFKAQVSSEPSRSLFSFSKPPETSQNEETPATTTVSSPFPSFKPPEPSEKQDTPAPTTVPAVVSASIFSGSSPSVTSEVSTAKLNPFADSLSSFASPKHAEPSQNNTLPNPSSLFPASKSPFQSAVANDTSTVAAEPVTESSSPFNFASPAPPSSSSLFKSPHTTTTAPKENTPFSFATPTAPTQRSFSVLRPTQSPATAEGHSQSLFMPSKPNSDTSSQSQGSMFSQDAFAPGRSTPTFGSNQAPGPLFPNVATAPLVEQEVHESQPQSTDPAITPPGSPKVAPAETNFFNRGQEPQANSWPESTEPMNQLRGATTVDTTNQSAHPNSSSETVEWQPPVYATVEEQTAAWEKFLYRNFPGVCAQSPNKDGNEHSKRRSLLNRLRTNPAQKRAKELCKPKPPTEEEILASKPNKRQVDEDELLLNDARIAAEQLRNGSIFDGISPYSELFRSSYIPRNDFGRTLSRTEQRIRMTGAHGLAYKPLDFSRKERKDSTRREKESEREDLARKDSDKVRRSE